jgi:hypothetical protein
VKRSSPLRRSPMTRKSAVRIKPKKRKPSEFARIYGSKERVLFVKALPCLVSNLACRGDVDNHHVENGGLSRKGDYQTIVPLCDVHHDVLHRLGAVSFAGQYGIDLKAAAAETEAKWLASQLYDDYNNLQVSENE